MQSAFEDKWPCFLEYPHELTAGLKHDTLPGRRDVARGVSCGYVCLSVNASCGCVDLPGWVELDKGPDELDGLVCWMDQTI